MTVAARTGGETSERHDVVAVAHELARRELVPHSLELDERRPGALEIAWGHVTEVGFDRALLAVDDGGVGLDAGSLLLCLEEMATGDAGVALLVLLANAALAALPPERAAEVGEGERWALVPTPSEQLATSARIAVRDGVDSRPTISGTLSPTLGALGADGIVVAAPGEEPAMLALAAEAPGLRMEACEPQLGLRSAAAARISLPEVAAELVSGPEEAGSAAAASLALLRAGSAAIARGVARRAFEVALDYAQTRVQGGVAIVEHDAVRRMLAGMAVGLAAAPAPDGAWVDQAAALAAKVAASDAAVAASCDAVQVFGGTGYMHETGVEKLMRDAKYLQLWPEPNWTADDAIVDAAINA
jgi:alkylation response protein AidB-like acyl-CoA dehydrogenase